MLASENDLLVRYQATLLARGVPIFWWSDVTAGMPAFAAIHLAGVRRIFEGEADSLEFRPDAPFPPQDRAAIEERAGKAVPWPAGSTTRAQAAQLVASTLGWL